MKDLSRLVRRLADILLLNLSICFMLGAFLYGMFWDRDWLGAFVIISLILVAAAWSNYRP